jgi:mannose-1-phosphate guanylyltransferase
VNGYIVAEEGNVLLICKKGDSSALVSKYVNEVLIKYGEEFV